MLLNNLKDAQKLKAIVSRAFDGEDGNLLMEYLETLGNYNMPIFEKEDEGARRMVITLKNILRLAPIEILSLEKGISVEDLKLLEQANIKDINLREDE